MVAGVRILGRADGEELVRLEGAGMKDRECAIVNGYIVRLKEMTNSEILAALEKAKEDSQDSEMLEETVIGGEADE